MAHIRGSEDQFKALVDDLAKNCKRYETGAIKYIAFTENMDSYFAEYGWSKVEFYKELNVRLGIANKEEPKVEKPKKKVVRKKP
jgi:hypothetical protein